MQTLTLPGKLESLKQIRDFVVLAAERAGLEKRAAYRLNLAVDEIATNIVIHAYEEAGLQGDVVVRADYDEHRLTIRLEDTGREYHPSPEGQEAYFDTPLEQRPEGGLGVFLAARNVDQFIYENQEGRNLHTLVMELNQSSTEGSHS